MTSTMAPALSPQAVRVTVASSWRSVMSPRTALTYGPAPVIPEHSNCSQIPFAVYLSVPILGSVSTRILILCMLPLWAWMTTRSTSIALPTIGDLPFSRVRTRQSATQTYSCQTEYCAQGINFHSILDLQAGTETTISASPTPCLTRDLTDFTFGGVIADTTSAAARTLRNGGQRQGILILRATNSTLMSGLFAASSVFRLFGSSAI